jgi:CRP/FNR family transcriptional regulator, cyclic AMP receptor protein
MQQLYRFIYKSSLGKEDTELSSTASRSKVNVGPSAPKIKRVNALKTKKRRRTKGPSQKIRSLAALSLAEKVGYLNITNLVGQDNAELEEMINVRLPKRTFKKGDTIYPTNQKGPVLFLVKSGSVSITRRSAVGHEFDIKTIGPGTVFGEVPALGQTMLGAHAVAAENVKVILINSAEFEKLAAESPSLVLNMVRQIGPRLVEAERRHEQAAFQPVTARVASLLTRLANKDHQVVGYTHQEMADLLGVYRETVTNAIAELKQDRLIKVGRKRITVLDPDALKRMETI